ncbi:MAG TPA: DUF2231 domain-containing protein [Gemmatimonadaceae bacterium]|nr:DUF2231 domain-containing protein [Gemmatimonadaceae bacterium]
MEARAKVLGHAIHQMLIPYPLALLTTAIIFDAIHLFTGTALWAVIAFWMIAAGIIGGLAAALFGAIDWRAIPSGTRAKRIGLIHGVGNVVMVLLFATSWLLRRGDPGSPGTFAQLLSLAGAGLSLYTGWLGGELVDRLGVGVDDGASLDAPSSLSGRSARGRATSAR